jgi:beta-phosphoglucomutase-like phosphatase (HAD superfamily)
MNLVLFDVDGTLLDDLRVEAARVFVPVRAAA